MTLGHEDAQQRPLLLLSVSLNLSERLRERRVESKRPVSVVRASARISVRVLGLAGRREKRGISLQVCVYGPRPVRMVIESR